MEITDVRVRLVQDANERLKAVCSVTFDDQFVVRDVKIVDGTHGLFVAMPSRKLTVPCPKCRTQNHVRARCCNECGCRLPPARIPVDDNGREKAHRDVAHPITPEFRQALQDRVLAAYHAEVPDRVEEEVEEEVEKEAVDECAATADANRGDETRESGEDVENRSARDEVIEEADEDVDNDDDEDDDVVEGEEQTASEYDSLIAGLKGGRGSSHAPRGRGPAPRSGQARSRGGHEGASRPAPAASRPEERDRGDGGDGPQRGQRRRGRGGRGRGDREQERPAAGHGAGGPATIAKDAPEAKPRIDRAGFVHDEDPGDDAFGAGMTPTGMAAPPSAPARSTSGRGKSQPKPRTEKRSRAAEKPPVEPAPRANAPAQPEPTPPPRAVESVDDDADAPFGLGIG